MRSIVRQPIVRRSIVRHVGIAIGAVAVLLVVAVGTVYALSGQRLRRIYPVVGARPPAVALDDRAVARGRHLVTAVANCTLCHGEDLGGTVYEDAGSIGVFAGPNLTRGRGAVGSTFTPADWDRAIRHGVRRDGTSLILMRSEAFVHLSDAELHAIWRYLQSVPPRPFGNK